ncbi:signal peptidase I [Asticcacaulis solisilvae]|uniref:signal peptidase I n=1 Tax=Asticcacaulis solisilvae TaxID=1217274 RepID=UPI003FD8ED70
MTIPSNETNDAIASAARAEAAPSVDTVASEETVETPVDARQAAVNEAKEIIGVVAIALALVLILRTVLFQPFTIPSASMEPNFYQGDYIIVSKWNYGISKYSLPIAMPIIKGRLFNHQATRGDVVVFKLPSNPKVDYIKRVIGLPGDRIQVRHDQLYVNDQAVPFTVMGNVAAEDGPGGQATLQREFLPDGRAHLMQDMVQDGQADDTQEFTVPMGNYFVMGDNRDNSLDSRFSPDDPRDPGVGFVPEENLEGRAVFILMSWKEGSSIWKPWTWLNFKWDRFFKGVQ